MNNNDIQGLFNGVQNFRRNAASIQGQMGIPKELVNNPDGVIQFLMNSGKISQAQFNQAMQMANQLKSNPLYQQMFK